jgi:hypothetical protein
MRAGDERVALTEVFRHTAVSEEEDMNPQTPASGSRAARSSTEAVRPPIRAANAKI